jgi:hypothetical protein
MSWHAHFHGGPADGQNFEVPREPLRTIQMENNFVDERGTLHCQVFVYFRVKLTEQSAIYYLLDVQTASRKESVSPSNLD